MRVFTGEFGKRIQERYGRQKEYGRPYIWHLTFLREFERARDNIERAVSKLLPTDREKLVHLIQSPKQTVRALNELGASYVFTSRGFFTHYEMRFGTLTPDWTVKTAAGDFSFVLEVFTDAPPVVEVSKRRWRYELESRIEEIPLDFTLCWEYNSVQGRPDQTVCRRAASGLSRKYLDLKWSCVYCLTREQTSPNDCTQ